MKLSALLLIMLAAIPACNKDLKDGAIAGKLINMPEATTLKIINVENSQVIQHINVNDGRFNWEFTIEEPGLFVICSDSAKYDKDWLLIWLENSKIKIEGDYNYFTNSKVTGSKSHNIYLIYDSITRKYNNEYSRLRILKSQTTDPKTLDSISMAFETIYKKYKKAKIDFYTRNLGSEVALYYLYSQTTMPDFYHYEEYLLSKNDIKQIFDLLPEESKTSSKGKLLAEYIHLPDIPKKGEKFINITLKTPEGKGASISENLGKFTLIEFWASNCGPCRIKHPLMRILYEKYHDAGLNIIGISADTHKEAWTAAIKSDTLPWLNISDLKGFNSSAFMIYGVKSIPKLILLDENGIILDNELANRQIDIYLNNLFKENGL